MNAALNQHELVEKGGFGYKTKVERFVFTSSIAAYGATEDPSELPMRESNMQRPEDPYGVSKHAMELDLKAAHMMFRDSFKYTIFRPHNVYGPKQNIADKFRNAIGIFMNQILRKEAITIFGDGMQTRAFSYIDDVAHPIAASVLFDQAINNDFFIGADKPYSVKELAFRVAESMGAPPNITYLAKRNEVEDAYASHEKLKCVFNPPPTVDLVTGLKITADYVKKYGSYPPTGFTNIETWQNMPPSWRKWLDITKPE